MGCLHSVPRKSKLDRTTPEEIEAARKLAEQEAARKKAALEAGADEHDEKLVRRDTAVLKQASVFDQLHEDAMKDPSFRDLKIVRGQHSMKLLESFETKEQESKESPELVKVEGRDLRDSKLYGRLREFEAMDEKVKAEPKLEKSFVQRERESQRGIGESWGQAESRGNLAAARANASVQVGA